MVSMISKFTHIEQVIKLLLKHGKRALSGPKALSIYEIWEKGGKVAVVQLGQDTSNFEAASNENAVITALGLETLTNIIGASCYGEMKRSWNNFEIINYGKMLLYTTLKNLTVDKPVSFSRKDILQVYPK